MDHIKILINYFCCCFIFIIFYFRLPWSIFQSDRDTNNNNNVNDKQSNSNQQSNWQLNLPTDYRNKFTDNLFNTLRKSIEEAAKKVQAYFDYPNELFHELHSHVANCRLRANSILPNTVIFEILSSIQKIMQISIDQQQQQQNSSIILSSNSPILTQSTARHAPIVVIGGEGSGKSTILAQVFFECENWFHSGS